MANLIKLLTPAWIFAAMLCLPATVYGQADLCLTAIRKIAGEGEVPESVLLAVARIESGRNGDEPLPAWPWAVNQAGASHWFATRREAEAHVAAALLAGEENIDIGCLQLNHRWHGAGFTSVSQMFDPIGNARYAAQFLLSLYAEEPDWAIAAGKYHSRTPTLAEAYRGRFQAALAATHSTSGQIKPKSKNNFPLLNGGPAGLRGSTVPAVTGVGSLFFLQARRIIGD